MRRYVFRLALVTLAVLGSSAARGDDEQIAQQIIQKYKAAQQDGSLKGFKIDLQVDEGTVWLSGRVANDAQQTKALDVARRIPGVKQVVNDLTVGEPVAKSAAPTYATPAARPSGTQKITSAVSNYFVRKPQRSEAEQSEPAEERSLVQPVSTGSEADPVAASTPIGSGLDPAASSRRQTVVQAAQPVANVPQGVAYANVPQQLQAMPMQMQAYVPMVPAYAGSRQPVPLAMGPAQTINYQGAPSGPQGMQGGPVPMHMAGSGVGIAPARYDHPSMPGYAWPSYAAYPNYAAVTYPKQYSPTAWPYIGPFYPYPQVPLGWRKVTLEWDDGWWQLDFKDRRTMYNK